VLIDASLPRRAWRDAAVASIERFAEVRLGVTAPLEGSAEGPEPDLTVDTGVTPAELAAEMIATLGLSLGPARRRPTGGGAVVWLTGPPGSGKTTLATRLADALTLDGVAFTVLEWQALRAAVLGTGWASPAGEDVAHRALVYLAKLLADTGLVVVVDATAPRRAWRALAREAIDVFAEVQLVCPLEICGDRERAVRWRPQPHPRGGVALTAPEAAVEYEVSLNPELVLDTHARSEWSAAEDVLRLTRRLLGRRPAAET
jgi:bifunctional enzyme CysN/CysC